MIFNLHGPNCCVVLSACEATMLEEGISDHCHERVTVLALPGPSLEVIEAEFLFNC